MSDDNECINMFYSWHLWSVCKIFCSLLRKNEQKTCENTVNHILDGGWIKFTVSQPLYYLQSSSESDTLDTLTLALKHVRIKLMSSLKSWWKKTCSTYRTLYLL